MVRVRIAELVTSIEPVDEREADDRQNTLDWLASGADLFRVKKPDVPNKHLVSYFAVVDPNNQTMLLQDHLIAHLWLPPGGHVDPGEDPVNTVRRECQEELGIDAVFFGEPTPKFITVTKVNDRPGAHTDVSLWFVLQASQSTPLKLEENKFKSVQWWNIRDIIKSPIKNFDPEFHRFCNKIQADLARG